MPYHLFNCYLSISVTHFYSQLPFCVCHTVVVCAFKNLDKWEVGAAHSSTLGGAVWNKRLHK